MRLKFCFDSIESPRFAVTTTWTGVVWTGGRGGAASSEEAVEGDHDGAQGGGGRGGQAHSMWSRGWYAGMASGEQRGRNQREEIPRAGPLRGGGGHGATGTTRQPYLGSDRRPIGGGYSRRAYNENEHQIRLDREK